MAPRTHGTGPRHSGDKPAHRGKRKIDRKHICQLGRQHLALLPGPDSKSLHELQRNANRKPGMYQNFRALLSPSKVADGKAAEKASVSARFISHLGLQTRWATHGKRLKGLKVAGSVEKQTGGEKPFATRIAWRIAKENALLDLSRPPVTRMLPQVSPMWALCWPYVGPCRPYVGLT